VKSLRDADAALLEANKDKLEPVVCQRARHVIGEISRTTDAVAAMEAGDWPTVGRLMGESHASLRDDFEVSCSELDEVVEIAGSIGSEGGVIGCRMTGGGFGGCAVALVESANVKDIAASIAVTYKERTGIEPALFVSRPAPGTQVIKTA
jgi:galactokinase